MLLKMILNTLRWWLAVALFWLATRIVVLACAACPADHVQPIPPSK